MLRVLHNVQLQEFSSKSWTEWFVCFIGFSSMYHFFHFKAKFVFSDSALSYIMLYGKEAFNSQF
jgi:hypothetical protein